MTLTREAVIAALLKSDQAQTHRPPVPQAVVGLIFSEDLRFFLLTRRSDSLRSHSGQVALPGGMIDQNETDIDAIVRECREELGIATDDSCWLRPHFKDTQSITGARVRVYVGHLPRPHSAWQIVPQSTEVADWAWCSVADLFDHSKWVSLSQIPGTSISYSALAWQGWTHLTWGLTAGILQSFVRRLGFDPLK